MCPYCTVWKKKLFTLFPVIFTIWTQAKPFYIKPHVHVQGTLRHKLYNAIIHSTNPRPSNASILFKEVRGSFDILFWLPCATWHRVMTHTHLTHFDRPTFFFATRRQGRSEVIWGFLLHPSGLSFGFQAWCTGSTRTNKRRRFQKSSVVDWMMPKSEEWIRRKRRRRRSIDEQASGCMVDLLNLSWDALSGRQCGLSFLCWWTWGMSSRSFTKEEVDSSPRLLLEQTTSTPRCRSGECIHNQLVSISLAVLYFNLHFRCRALMHQENNQSSVTAEADGLQLDSAFAVTSGVTSQNVEGRTEPSLKVNCFYTDMKKLHLHWVNKSFMLYQCTVHGGHRFSVQGPRATDFFWQWDFFWSSKSMFFFFIKPHASQPGCLGWWMSFNSAKVNVLSITFWWLPEDLQSTT